MEAFQFSARSQGSYLVAEQNLRVKHDIWINTNIEDVGT